MLVPRRVICFLLIQCHDISFQVSDGMNVYNILAIFPVDRLEKIEKVTSNLIEL